MEVATVLTQRQLIKSELLTRHLGTSARFSHLGQIRVDTSSAPEVTFFSMSLLSLTTRWDAAFLGYFFFLAGGVAVYVNSALAPVPIARQTRATVEVRGTVPDSPPASRVRYEPVSMMPA